jgi:hypothetical protein
MAVSCEKNAKISISCLILSRKGAIIDGGWEKSGLWLQADASRRRNGPRKPKKISGEHGAV